MFWALVILAVVIIIMGCLAMVYSDWSDNRKMKKAVEEQGEWEASYRDRISK